ncbi:MAG TPA: hypothetical protein PKK13_11905 [Spirochaetota bacterium]|nr:MAG: hypothetical protein BWX91_01930 [Spirochaetes bacterium ADurb.Bin133]HNZ27918.1 hypothetical protein [Spirochaetota bacterium]
MKKILIAIFILLLNAFVIFPEVIILKDGSIIKGKIIKLDEDNITVLGSYEEIIIERNNIKKQYQSEAEYKKELEDLELAKKRSEESKETKTVVLKSQIILLKNGEIIKGSIITLTAEGLKVKTDSDEFLVKNEEIQKVYFSEEEYYKEKYASETKEKVIIQEKTVVVERGGLSVDDIMETKFFGIKLGTRYNDVINELKRRESAYEERNRDASIIVYRPLTVQPSSEYTLIRIKDGVIAEMVLAYRTTKETIATLSRSIGKEFQIDKQTNRTTSVTENNNVIELYNIKESNKDYVALRYFVKDKGIGFSKLDYKKIEFNIGFGLEHNFSIYYPLGGGGMPSQSVGLFLPLGMMFSVNKNAQVGFVNDLEYRAVFVYGLYPHIHQFNDRFKLAIKSGESTKLTKFVYEIGITMQYSNAIELWGGGRSGSSFLVGPAMSWMFESSNKTRTSGFQVGLFMEGSFGSPVYYTYWNNSTRDTEVEATFGATFDVGISLRWISTPRILF